MIKAAACYDNRRHKLYLRRWITSGANISYH